MIPADRRDSALYAMHLVLVEIRSMAFGAADHKVMAELLDWAEAMPFLIAQADEDRTESFRSHLRAVAQLCPRLGRALAAFENNHGFYGAPAER